MDAQAIDGFVNDLDLLHGNAEAQALLQTRSWTGLEMIELAATINAAVKHELARLREREARKR